MKKMLSVLLIVIVCLSCPNVHATDIVSDKTNVVSTLDELLDTLDDLSPYSTIEIACPIVIDRSCTIGNQEYEMSFIPSESFTGEAVFIIDTNVEQEVTFEGVGYRNSNIPFLTTNKAVEEDCNKPNLTMCAVSMQSNRLTAPLISLSNVNAYFERVQIQNNYIENANLVEVHENAKLEMCTSNLTNTSCQSGSAIKTDGILNLKNCNFDYNISFNYDEDILTYGGSVFVSDNGQFEAAHTSFQDNFGKIGGTIFSKGSISLIDCYFDCNTCVRGGADIYNCGGKLNISYPLGIASKYLYTNKTPIGFYLDNINNQFSANDEAIYLGEHITTEEFQLSYFGIKLAFTSDFAEDYIVPSSSNIGGLQDLDEKDIFIPSAGEKEPEVDEPTPEPQPDPPVEETPPSGEKDSSEEKDLSENAPSGEEDQPKEPEQPSDSDKPTPSQPPQESDNSNDHDDTPSKPYKPSHGASAPSTSTNPAPSQQLQCGEAVIDSTRSAKLAGYEDGLLHLEDSLTRAQMAKIIYGLLDENCIEKIGKSDDGFKDVTAEAWFYTAVSALHNAGVVNGVGGGNYNPNDTVTWAQIIAVLSRFVDEEDCTLQNIAYNGWAESVIKTAVSLKWIEDQSNFDANAVISRGEFVELVNHVLSLYA